MVLNQGPPDFKYSTLNHSATPAPETASLAYSLLYSYRQVIRVFHIKSILVKRFLIGFAVNNFPVLYDKLDHVVMATKLIDKMLPPTTGHTIRRELFKRQRTKNEQRYQFLK